jgi:hypothetical protein
MAIVPTHRRRWIDMLDSPLRHPTPMIGRGSARQHAASWPANFVSWVCSATNDIDKSSVNWSDCSENRT